MSVVQGTSVDKISLDGWFTQTISISALFGAIFGWWPYVVAAIPIIYYLIMIWETRTVVQFRNNWLQRRLSRRYAKLKVQEKKTADRLAAVELLVAQPPPETKH
jgi:hypothetical protein